MDQTGIYISLGTLSVIGAIVITAIWWWRRQTRNIETARSWPAVEATIESGTIEAVQDSSARAPIVLPVLAFSYQALGNFYAGRFSLSHGNTDADELIQKLIGRKLQVRYDPSAPDKWYIPDEQMEGCKVEQRIGPHVIALYPRE